RFQLASAFVLIATGLWSQAQPASEEYVSPGFEHRAFFKPGDSGLARLSAMGALLHVEDYGSFVLGVVDERRVGGRGALLGLGLEIRDDQAVIGFNGVPLDTADKDGLAARLAAIPEGLRASGLDAAPRGDSLWIVQFMGPIRDEWLA